MPARPPEGQPVSVLKPLHGAEPGLYENLRSFADQDYSDFQVVLGLRDRTDAALPIARALIDARPGRDIALVVDPHASGSNLKVANLENMLPAARHDLIVIADSDMRVTRDYLAVVAAPLADPAVGIVTCPYKGVPDGRLWSRLAALHINFGFLPAALVGDGWGSAAAASARRSRCAATCWSGSAGSPGCATNWPTTIGMGSAVRGLGLKAVLSPYIVENRVSEPVLASLWRHELRWARTSRMMAPGGFAGSVVTHTVVLVALAAVVCEPVAAGALLRRGRACCAGLRRRRSPLARPAARRAWLLPLRDVLSFAVFLAS